VPDANTGEESVDQLLDRLEKVVGRLAEAREPIEELVVAYEEGIRLLAEAQARLETLAAVAEAPA
jgi:exodeoxyribonuclease VII small subunit